MPHRHLKVQLKNPEPNETSDFDSGIGPYYYDYWYPVTKAEYVDGLRNGSKWFDGTSITAPTSPIPEGLDVSIGDYYLNSNTWNIWECISLDDTETTDRWLLVGNIKGQDGNSINIKGSVTSPSNLPTDPQPEIGDCYVINGSSDPDENGHLWVYTGNTQTTDPTHINGYEDLGSLQGPAGEDGDDAYVHIKYASTSTPSAVDMHDNITSTDKYIGIYADHNVNASSLYTAYRWAKIVGEDGTSAGFGTPTATIGTGTGTPSVTITTSGQDTAKVFNFAFDNLKGTNGTNGITPNITATATVDSNIGIPSVVVTQGGTTASPTINFAFKNLKGASGSGSGTLSSVGLRMPSVFNVSGSPLTQDGDITVSLDTQGANKVFAGPISGSSAVAPTFRALVAADIPDLNWSKITSGKPTTLDGYGITDAYISNGTITLGNSNITPLTSHAYRPISIDNTSIIASSSATALNLVAGNNITLTPELNNNEYTGKVSISSTGGSSTDTHRIVKVRGANEQASATILINADNKPLELIAGDNIDLDYGSSDQQGNYTGTVTIHGPDYEINNYSGDSDVGDGGYGRIGYTLTVSRETSSTIVVPITMSARGGIPSGTSSTTITGTSDTSIDELSFIAGTNISFRKLTNAGCRSGLIIDANATISTATASNSPNGLVVSYDATFTNVSNYSGHYVGIPIYYDDNEKKHVVNLWDIIAALQVDNQENKDLLAELQSLLNT